PTETETTESDERTRNIILLGPTGGGKSAVGNVLAGTDLFAESRSISGKETKQGDFEWEVEGKNIKYQIHEIPDFLEKTLGKEVQKKAEKKFREVLATGGINQIFLVYQKRNQLENITAYYDWLAEHEIPRQYLTIVRTNFPSFESEEEVREEKESLIEETEKLGEVFSSIDSLCIDTPQPTRRSKEGN